MDEHIANIISAAAAISTNARLLSQMAGEKYWPLPSAQTTIMEMRHDLEDALKSVKEWEREHPL